MSASHADSFQAFLYRQRQRIRKTTQTAVQRVERKVSQLDPVPMMETKGLPQPWHRDVTDEARLREDEF